jgi:nodulation protein F
MNDKAGVTMTALEDQLAAMLGSYVEQDTPAITADTEIASLGVESVRIMEFIMDVEDEHDISIDLEQLGRIHTIAELAAVVQSLKNG